MPSPLQPDDALRVIFGLSSAVLTPDGKSAIVNYGGGSDTLRKFDLATGQLLASWQIGRRIGNFDITPDGRYVIAAESDPGPQAVIDGRFVYPIYVDRLDLTTGESRVLMTYSGGTASGLLPFYGVATIGDGKAILTQRFADSAGNLLTTLDIAAGTFTTSAQSGAIAGALVASADHSHALIAPTLGYQQSPDPNYATVSMYVAGQGVIATLINDVSLQNGTVQSLSRDGQLALVSTYGGKLLIYDQRLNAVVDLAALHPELGQTGLAPTSAVFSPDGTMLYVYSARANEIFALSTAGWGITAEIAIGVTGTGTAQYLAYGGNLQISADGRYLVSGNALIDLDRATMIDPKAANTLSAQDTGGTILYGFEGNDTLTAHAFSNRDTLVGGPGDDSYYMDANVVGASTPFFSFGTIIEAAGEGYDTIYTSYGRIAPNVERIVGISTTRNLLFGGDGDDLIVGNVGADLIAPGAGHDTIELGGGNDVVAGQRGDLAGDLIRQFGYGDALVLRDFNSPTYLNPGGAYVPPDNIQLLRSGSSLTIGPDMTVTLEGLVGGRFVLGSTSDNATTGSTGLLALAITFRPAPVDFGDFNGDSHSDLLWRNTSGALSTWTVAGNTAANQVQQGAYNGTVDPSWKIVETFDFNGDGRSDILYRQSGGAVAIWGSTGAGFSQSTYYRPDAVPISWRIAGAGDLNGDGKDDLLWQNANGSLSAWQSTGTGFTEGTYNRASIGSSWQVAGLGDFNGDGKADILWRNTDGGVAVWTNNGAGTSFNESAFFQRGVPTSWHIDGIGDFNGDGRDDLIWRNDDGAVTVWRSNAGGGFDQSVFNQTVPTAWQIAQVGDLNADGRADIVWLNTNGQVSTWQSNGAGFDQGVYNATAPGGWSIAGHEFIL